MERDRTAPQSAKHPILRLIKGLVWLIALVFGGLGLAVGYYALNLDDRIKTRAEQILARASLLDVQIASVTSDMGRGMVQFDGIVFSPDAGRIERAVVYFNPRTLKKPGEVPIDRIEFQGGTIRQWGRLAFMPMCPEPGIVHRPDVLNLMIGKIDWQNVTLPTTTPSPDYLAQGAALNLHAGQGGVCRF